MSVIDPSKSWASKWHHVSKGVAGVYALVIPQHVFDGLPEEVRGREKERRKKKGRERRVETDAPASTCRKRKWLFDLCLFPLSLPRPLNVSIKLGEGRVGFNQGAPLRRGTK